MKKYYGGLFFIFCGLLSGMTSCAKMTVAGETEEAEGGVPIKWKMVTAWPKDFPVVGTGANNLARNIGELSGGRLTVHVYGAGELGGGLDVLDMVTRGVAEMGHAASFYWRGRIAALQFFGATPYGMTANEMNAWLYYGGGQELWEKVYAPLGLLAFPAGHTGVQMGGWFNKEVSSLADIAGMRMRIPGLGGEVFSQMGGLPVVLPAGEIFTALTSGVLDAAEFSGPANDIPQGFHKAAHYYYYPGWQEPTTVTEAMINRKAFSRLSPDLKAIVRTAIQAANASMSAEYTYRNIRGLQDILLGNDEIDVRPFPEDLLHAAWEATREVLARLAAEDETFAAVQKEYEAALSGSMAWTALSEQTYLQVRAIHLGKLSSLATDELPAP